MPPSPSHHTAPVRLRPHRWVRWSVVPGLVLGFVAGVQLARAERDGIMGTGRESASSVERVEGTATQMAPAPSVARPTPRPTDPSLREGPPSTDPRAWLERFGEVETGPGGDAPKPVDPLASASAEPPHR